MRENSLRFGGQEVNGRFLFELSGGALALDFVNTLDERRAAPIERLKEYGGLLDWAAQAGPFSSTEGETLLTAAKLNPARADEVLKAAIRLREFLFEAIQVLVAGKHLSDAALKTLNEWISKASRRRRLVMSGPGLVWSWGQISVEPDAVLWCVVDSAASIFASDDLRSRLRICGGSSCAWVFLDFSPKQNRHWCDMSVCGNRAKARRHYQRSRAAAIETNQGDEG
jgi:predicted RNA-binding Zn ribbon-like protein